MAAASASGISGMVSREDILGLRERILDGVDGIDDADADDKQYDGYDSLNFAEKLFGEGCIEVGLLHLGLPKALSEFVRRGDEGRRRILRGNVLWDIVGEVCGTSTRIFSTVDGH